MKGRFSRLALAVAAAGFVLVAAPHAARAQNIQAYAANWLYFANENEAHSHAIPLAHATGGDLIYTNQVVVPASINVLYVSFDAAADLNGNLNAMFLGCLVDDAPCRDTAGPDNGAPSGWVMVQKLTNTAQPDTESDQTIHYTWCTPIHKLPGRTGTTHNVQLRLAAEDTNHNVYLEQLHVFVNGAKIAGRNLANACTNAGTPAP